MDAEDLMDGRYRLLDRLGAGGMSVVWRAHDEVLQRDVAVKVLSPELAADPDLLHRIRSEARSAARLRHPNIVEVYDYGEVAGGGRRLPYVVMEVVEGRSLAQLLTGGALPWRVAVLICAQVAAALAAAHSRGVVHRDVKPGNVMVAGGGVKLVDFGISATSGETDATGGELLGTPAYLAPERLERGLVRPATDVYALGLLLYRALAGRLPWQASTTTQMIAAHRYHEPAALPAIADLPGEVSELCQRCLLKEPDRRPAAAEVAEVLGVVAGLAPATLLLSDATTPAGVPAASVPTRTAPHASGLTRTVAAWSASGPLGAPLRRWRHLPSRGRIAGAAGVVVLLSGAVGAAVLTGGPPGETGRVVAGTPSAVAAMGQRTPSCAVSYTVGRAADGRFSTTVSIANTGAVPVPDGRLTFAFPSRQRLVAGSPGTWSQSGQTVQAHIGDLPPERSVTATVKATYRGANALPDRFQLNGTACRTTLSVAGRTTRPVPDEDEKKDDKKKNEDKDEEKGDD